MSELKSDKQPGTPDQPSRWRGKVELGTTLLVAVTSATVLGSVVWDRVHPPPTQVVPPPVPPVVALPTEPISLDVKFRPKGASRCRVIGGQFVRSADGL